MFFNFMKCFYDFCNFFSPHALVLNLTEADVCNSSWSRMNCVPLKLICKAQIPSVTVFGHGACKGIIKVKRIYKGGVLIP